MPGEWRRGIRLRLGERGGRRRGLRGAELFSDGKDAYMRMGAMADMRCIRTVLWCGGRRGGRHGDSVVSREPGITVVGIGQQRLYSRAEKSKRGEQCQQNPSPGTHPW